MEMVERVVRWKWWREARIGWRMCCGEASGHVAGFGREYRVATLAR